MNKEKFIKRRGKAAYEKWLKKTRDWREVNPDKILEHSQEQNRKGGKYYEHKLEYMKTGLQGKRNIIRDKHRYQYHQFKNIIAPESQIHHEWVPKTSKYKGMALVERDQHIHGFIDVIKILEGKITLFRER